MPKIFSILPVIALLTIGTTLSAQDDATAQPAEEAATEAMQDAVSEDTAADPASEEATESGAEAETEMSDTAESDAAEADDASNPDLDMGKEVVQDPTYVKETYGDWQLKCFRTETEEDPCQMFQLLKEDTGQPIAEFSIFRLPGNSQAVAGATIVVPLGTLLSEELKISVDGGKAKSYSYSFCSMVGCFARIGLTQADIDAFKRGVTANLMIVPAQAPDQKVGIKASLSGFTAAFENASVLQN